MLRLSSAITFVYYFLLEIAVFYIDGLGGKTEYDVWYSFLETVWSTKVHEK